MLWWPRARRLSKHQGNFTNELLTTAPAPKKSYGAEQGIPWKRKGSQCLLFFPLFLGDQRNFSHLQLSTICLFSEVAAYCSVSQLFVEKNKVLRDPIAFLFQWVSRFGPITSGRRQQLWFGSRIQGDWLSSCTGRAGTSCGSHEVSVVEAAESSISWDFYFCGHTSFILDIPVFAFVSNALWWQADEWQGGSSTLHLASAHCDVLPLLVCNNVNTSRKDARESEVWWSEGQLSIEVHGDEEEWWNSGVQILWDA